jgi:glycine/D-amino acid oxidase-like deaminating enzyme
MTATVDYSGRSLWLDTLAAPIVPRPRLGGDVAADVVIVGAGFIGLWTAYCLARAEPTREIVVLEAEIAGFGAAGRNAGFVSAGIAGKAQAYLARGGWDGVQRAERAMIDGIDHVGEVVAREGIQCGWTKGGSLRIATSHAQLERIRAGLTSRPEGAPVKSDVQLLRSLINAPKDRLRAALAAIPDRRPSRGWPVLEAPAARIDEAPASPPRNR